MTLTTALEQIRIAIDDPGLLRLLDYWSSKVAADRLPGRPDIDPQDMRFMLGNLLLVDVERGPLRFRYRLIGTNLTTHIGLDLTGRPVDDHPDPTFRAQALEIYAGEIYAGLTKTGLPCGFCRNAMIDGRLRRYQVLFLPLAADGRTVDMVLAGISFDVLPRN
tara:strand:- start:531 stop:1019 length:489 start_codon:yes stop_codon:yes gene_type:complete